MIVECPRCEARVDAKLIADYVIPGDEYSDPYMVCLMSCPACKSAIFGGFDQIQTDYDESGWGEPKRLWPDSQEHLDVALPPLVRKALEDAKRCYQAQVYPACAVMCGRAIEAVCFEKTGQKKSLQTGLKRLRDNKEIEDRLYEWGDILRKERNIGAHANEEATTKEDARDILDFAFAICEYVYVLSEKYKNFIRRKHNGSRAEGA